MMRTINLTKQAVKRFVQVTAFTWLGFAVLGLAQPAAARESSLQSLVDSAAPASVVTVPAGVYRETIKITKPLTLSAEPGAEIRGSDIWSDWAPSDGVWRSAQTLPPFAARGECLPGAHRCVASEQVFVDGAPLSLNPGGRPSPGQFSVDGQRHVVVGSDPHGHTVEVSMRTAWVVAEADGVTIEGFTMKHAANTAQMGAISLGTRSNWTIAHNVLSDVHGTVVSLGAGNNNALVGNDISRGGQLGVAAGNGAGNLIKGNRIHHNNTDGFNPAWEAGGLKAALTVNSVWEDNDVYNNNGPGLWCDIKCRGLVVAHNRVHDNVKAPGILFEISDGAKIFGNSAWNNGRGLAWGWGGGIVLSSSANAEVFDNVVAFNQSGISVIAQQRSDRPPAGPVNNYVHDNTIVMDEAPESLSLSFLDDWNGQLFEPGSHNRGDSNTYWYPGPENGYTRFGWRGPIGSLGEFESTPSGSGTYLNDAEANQVLATVGIGDLASARRAAGGG
jgi:hypothetical protein